MIKQILTYDKKTYNLKSYKEYIDNVLTKTELYDKQGNLYKVKAIQQQLSYKNGVFHGINKVWNEDGNLYSYSKYKNGKRHGVYKLYYPNSIQMCHEYHYKNGEYNGICNEWYPNGNLRQKGIYKNGKLLQRITYNTHGHITETKNYMTNFI